VYEQYSGKSVITTEWIDGTKVVNERAKVSPQDMPLLQVGIQCTLMQLLDKGVAHCDPHGTSTLCIHAYSDYALTKVLLPCINNVKLRFEL
jgi:predicted unusual protein kinase regulating ubiquinone biosynthesis (AarF/ABC1/UbiB family)